MGVREGRRMNYNRKRAESSPTVRTREDCFIENFGASRFGCTEPCPTIERNTILDTRDHNSHALVIKCRSGGDGTVMSYGGAWLDS